MIGRQFLKTRMVIMQRDLVLIRLPILVFGATVMMLGCAAAQTPNVRYLNPSTMAKPPGYTHVHS
jgi:hypothetical protein